MKKVVIVVAMSFMSSGHFFPLYIPDWLSYSSELKYGFFFSIYQDAQRSTEKNIYSGIEGNEEDGKKRTQTETGKMKFWSCAQHYVHTKKPESDSRSLYCKLKTKCKAIVH